MTWTHEQPTKRGLYWYRSNPDSPQESYEALKVDWDDRNSTWSVGSTESVTGFVARHDGEWYGPLSPPVHLHKEWDPTDTRCNARIIVRLRHGGSFYVKKNIPDETAQLLSRKLKMLREHGDSIPINLRMKISDVVRELITFTGLPTKQEKVL
jgi:hypothetical protein